MMETYHLIEQSFWTREEKAALQGADWVNQAGRCHIGMAGHRISQW
jgi:hypothetical protein